MKLRERAQFLSTFRCLRFNHDIVTVMICENSTRQNALRLVEIVERWLLVALTACHHRILGFKLSALIWHFFRILARICLQLSFEALANLTWRGERVVRLVLAGTRGRKRLMFLVELISLLLEHGCGLGQFLQIWSWGEGWGSLGGQLVGELGQHIFRFKV